MIHEKILIEENSNGNAYLYTYIWEEPKEPYWGKKRPMILICPGGAYRMISDQEAEVMAVRFMSMGYHTAVLHYSVSASVFPVALCQLAKAVGFLRKKKELYSIEEDKIIIMGFSAGGHLAACLGAFWNRKELEEACGIDRKRIRPNGMILGYPVITSGKFGHQESFHNLLGDKYENYREQLSLEHQITKYFPRTFLWHTISDRIVPPENSFLLVKALRREKISVEFHLFPQGNHGIGLGNELTAKSNGNGLVPACTSWSELAQGWLNREFPWGKR